MALRPSATPARQRFRPAALALLAVPALLLASSCSLLNGSSGQSNSSASTSASLEKTTIKVGYMQVTDCTPFQIALKKGYFKQEGLNVQAVPVVSGTQSVPMLVAGSLDVGFGNWATLLEAQAKRTGDFKIVADGSQGQAGNMQITARPDSGINTIQDLIGKTVSTNAMDDVPFLAFKAILQANNIDVNSIHMVVVHHADTPQALATKQVDAAIQLEPFKTLTARQIGARPVVDLFGPGPAASLPLAGYFTTSKFAKEDPKTEAAFARAMAKGAADAADRQTVEQMIPTFTKIDKGTAALVSLPTFPTSLDAKRLQRVADLMQTYGLLQDHMDVASLIVPSPPTS